MESIEQIEDLHLVAVVEKARRLVQQQDRPSLGEGCSDRSALAFTPGQRRHRAIGEIGHSSQLHGVVDRRRIGLGKRGPRVDVGITPHFNE
jgi:hypothetical protein